MTARFSQATLNFLAENRLQNSKPWFEAQREQYKDNVLAPLAALAADLTPALTAVDPKLNCSPMVDGALSRIWRDTRFSKDKSLYRDRMWCTFVRKKGLSLPEFFFVVSPAGFLYGCGYYSAGTASMESLRKLILAGDSAFAEAYGAFSKQNTFGLDGDMYKRSRHPDAPECLKAWLDRKTICFIHSSTDFGLLYSDDLSRIVAEGYKALAPVYRLLMKAEELAL